MKLAIVCPALGSHWGPLRAYATRMGALGHEIRVYTTGWRNKHGDTGLCINASVDLRTTVPDQFNIERATSVAGVLLDELRAFAPDVVVYDFFCLEAALAARALRVPSVCSLPCVAEPGLACDDATAARIRALPGGTIDVPVARASDAHYIPGSAAPLLWNLLSNVLGVPAAAQRIGVPRTALVSFGTVVPTSLLQHNASALTALTSALHMALSELDAHGIERVLLLLPGLSWAGTVAVLSALRPWLGATRREVEHANGTKYVAFEADPAAAAAGIREVFMHTQLPSAPQAEMLRDCEVLVTHGGGSSTAEALREHVTMWVFPFFGDQHYAARRVLETQRGSRADVIDGEPADSARDMSLDAPRRRVDGLPLEYPGFAGPGPRDLLYGRNADRLSLQAQLGLNLGVGDLSWMPRAPRIADHLNDVLIDIVGLLFASHELFTPGAIQPPQRLSALHGALNPYPMYATLRTLLMRAGLLAHDALAEAATLVEIFSNSVYGEWYSEVARAGLVVPSRAALDAADDDMHEAARAALHALCIHAIGWWARYGLVHFIVGELADENGATRAELAACLAHPEWTHVRYWDAPNMLPLDAATVAAITARVPRAAGPVASAAGAASA